jgi:hypothetical protein
MPVIHGAMSRLQFRRDMCQASSLAAGTEGTLLEVSGVIPKRAHNAIFALSQG